MSEHAEDGAVAEVLRDVRDPALDAPLGELGMVGAVECGDGVARIELRLPDHDLPARDVLEARIRAALADCGVNDVEITTADMDDDAIHHVLDVIGHTPAGGGIRDSRFKTGQSHARVIAISSGKGGVGKSSITTNLAVALAADGAAVGVLDADVWGFSVPRMLGVDRPPTMIGVEDTGMIIPPLVHGVRVVSMGFFTDEDTPVMWRGPMLHKAMEQFLVDVHWGELDFLVIDMPPGTGDVSISMSQFLPTAEVVVVTTPQPAAGRVAQRAGKMAANVDQQLIGVVENMSWLELPGGERRTVFGEGGGAELAADLEVPLLGQVPLDEELRVGADTGEPVVISHPEAPAAAAIRDIAARIRKIAPRKIRRPELRIKQT